MKQVGLVAGFVVLVALVAYVAIEFASRPSVPDRSGLEPIRPVEGLTPPSLTATPTPDVHSPEEPPVMSVRRSAVVEVRVTDAKGNPLRQAKVYFVRGGAEPGRILGRATNAVGRARAALTVPGTVAVLASAEGFARGGIPEIRLIESSTTSLQISLGRAAVISGVVREALSGDPLPGATVRAEPNFDPPAEESIWLAAGFPLEATAEADGTYHIAARPEGLYTVTAREEEHLPHSRAGVRAGTTKVDLILRKGGVIYGFVERAGTWERVPGARVVILKTETEEAAGRELVTDASGEFVFRQLHEGRYQVYAELGPERSHPSAEQGEQVILTFTQDAAEVSLSIREWEKGSISGTVTGLDGVPIERGVVSARREATEDISHTAVANFSGAYEFPELDEGTYRLTAEADARTGLERVVSLSCGEARSGVDFVLAPGFFVRGKVLAGDTMEPVAGCEVTVEDEAWKRAKTGSDGSYQLGPLTPGAYLLRVTALGRSLAGGGIRQVEVAGKDIDNMDFLLRVGGGVRGTVRSAAGPVSGAQVFLAFPPESPESPANDSNSTLTDEGGSYQLGGVQAGSVVAVVVRAPSYKLQMSPEITIPGGGWVDVPPIEVESSGAWVNGVVKGLSGDPVDDIPVVLESDTYKRGFRYVGKAGGEWWRWKTRSADGGQFRIGPLPEGEYMASVAIDPPWRPPVQRFSLGESGNKGLRFTLGELQRVRKGVIRGRVTRADGTPLSGIRISAWCRSFGDLGTTETDGAGNYSLGGLPQRLKLVVQADGGGSPAHTSLATKRRETIAPAEKVDFVLQETGAIAGRVLGTDGRPVGNFEVTLTRLDVAETAAPWEPAPETEPGSGRFIFRDPAPGNYKVTAVAPNRARGESPPVQVNPGRTAAGVEILLGEGATLTGTVVSAADGMPIAGARVFSRDATGPWRVRDDWPAVVTDQAGEFTVHHLSAGRIYVSADHGLYAASQPVPVDISEEGDPDPVQIRLSAGAVISGRVLDASEKPMPGERVTIRGRSAFMSAPMTAVTDGEGRFRRAHLPEGTYDVRWRSISRQVSVGTEDQTEVVFRAAE